MTNDRCDPLTGQPGPAQSLPVGQEGTWRNLLALAGPEQAPWLVRQIEADLTTQQRDLTRALGRLDAERVRAATHVLIALAGTIGATAVRDKATDLNAAAHLADADRMLAVGGRLLRDLSALLADVAARRDRLPPPTAGGTT